MFKAILFATLGAVITVVVVACVLWFIYLWFKNKIEKLFSKGDK